jgi:hypothetical protein
VYRFGSAEKQDMAQQIAGKSKQEALKVLMQQPGVSNLDIQVTGGDDTTLPVDSSQITVIVRSNTTQGCRGRSRPAGAWGHPNTVQLRRTHQYDEGRKGKKDDKEAVQMA